MALLGEFGQGHGDGEPDHFTFYGEAFEVPARISGLPLTRFAWRTREIEGEKSRAERAIARAATEEGRALGRAQKFDAEVAEMAAVHEFLMGTIGEEQWPRFEQVANRVGAQMPELMDVVAAIYQAVMQRPSMRPSESSDGPSPSGPGSMGGSVSPAPTPGPTVPGQEWPPVPVTPVPVVSPAQAARQEMAGLMVPVDDLLTRSGG